MSKTPQEMADEYVEAEFKENGGNVSRAVCKYDFMSGYKAAIDLIHSNTTKDMSDLANAFAANYFGKEYAVSFDSFLAGYQAAKDQLAYRNKVVTADYVETARNDAKELIAKYELEGDKDMLIKALVAAYCSGVDAVDGYLRNSLSAYRNSVKRLQWISVKERLPEISENDHSNRVLLLRADRIIVIARIEKCVRFVRPLQEALIVETDNGDPIEEFTHWMELPEAPKGEK